MIYESLIKLPIVYNVKTNTWQDVFTGEEIPNDRMNNLEYRSNYLAKREDSYQRAKKLADDFKNLRCKTSSSTDGDIQIKEEI